MPIAVEASPKIPLHRPSRTPTFENATATGATPPEMPATMPAQTTPDLAPKSGDDQEYEALPPPKIPTTRPTRSSPSPVPASPQPKIPTTRPARPASADIKPELAEASHEKPKIPSTRPTHKTPEQSIDEEILSTESPSDNSDNRTGSGPELAAPKPIIAQLNQKTIISVEDKVEETISQRADSSEPIVPTIPSSRPVKTPVSEKVAFAKEVSPEHATPSIPSARPVKTSSPAKSSSSEPEEQENPVKATKPGSIASPAQSIETSKSIETPKSIEASESIETSESSEAPKSIETPKSTETFESTETSKSTEIIESLEASETKLEEQDKFVEKPATPVVPSRPTKVISAKSSESERSEKEADTTKDSLETDQTPKHPSVPLRRPSRPATVEPLEVSETVIESDKTSIEPVQPVEVKDNDASTGKVVESVETGQSVTDTSVPEPSTSLETKPKSTVLTATEEEQEKPHIPSTRPVRLPEVKGPEVPVRPATRPKPARPPSGDNTKVPPSVPPHKPLPAGGVPPRPKKLSSMAGMFERQATSAPAPPTKPKPPAKLNKVGALRASLFKDLDTMISRGGVPPPMGFPKPAAQAASEDNSGDLDEKEKPKEEQKKLTDVRRGRAKGPKRKLPSAATKALIVDTPVSTTTPVVVKFESFVGGDVWSVGGKNLEISQKEEKERLKREEEERLKREEEERLKREEEERLKREEEERLRKLEEERLRKEEEERLKKLEEEERLKKLEEEERLKKLEEEERLKKLEEEERLKKLEEEQLEQKKEEEVKEEEVQLKKVEEKPLEKSEEQYLKKTEKNVDEAQKESDLKQNEEMEQKNHSGVDLDEFESADEQPKQKVDILPEDTEVLDNESSSGIKTTIKTDSGTIKSLDVSSLPETAPLSSVTATVPLHEEDLSSTAETGGATAMSIGEPEVLTLVKDSDLEPKILEPSSVPSSIPSNLEESEVSLDNVVKIDSSVKPLKPESSEEGSESASVVSDNDKTAAVLDVSEK